MTLTERFRRLKEGGEKALVLFVTAGDPSLADLPAILSALEEGGADVIEVGLPFSDPFGEGPTIQASSQRALDRHTTTDAILETLSKVNLGVPLVTMGYYNMVLRRGLDRFAQETKRVGSTGAIINDLVPDEADAWCDAAREAGQETIFLVAPTSTPHRIREAAEKSTGFVYIVSRTGVTGAESEMPPEVTDLVTRVKTLTDRPACIGFGLSRPEHVRLACQIADGAVVGSALVKKLYEEWNGGAGRADLIEWVKTLKAATRG